MQGKAQIDQALRQKSDAKEIPGVVAMAATGKEVVYQGAFGKRDLSEDVAKNREDQRHPAERQRDRIAGQQQHADANHQQNGEDFGQTHLSGPPRLSRRRSSCHRPSPPRPS